MSVTSPVFSRSLVGFVKFSFNLITKTGLLIRMPVHAQVYKIGGADLYPMTTRYNYDGIGEIEVPFIPGSSLKGRMRGLLETATKQKFYTTDEKIWSYVRSLSAMEDVDIFLDDIKSRNVISELFGWAAANYRQVIDALHDKQKKNLPTNYNERDIEKLFSESVAPTRLLFSDLYPSSDYVRSLRPRSVADFLEEKPENRIDRVTSAADPREVVRVRPGVEFSGDITLLLYDIDKGKLNEYLNTLVLGMELVEATYLGGSGSRGYGRVVFRNICVKPHKIVKTSSSEGSVFYVKPLVSSHSGETYKELCYDDLEKLKQAIKDLLKILEELFV